MKDFNLERVGQVRTTPWQPPNTKQYQYNTIKIYFLLG